MTPERATESLPPYGVGVYRDGAFVGTACGRFPLRPAFARECDLRIRENRICGRPLHHDGECGGWITVDASMVNWDALL